MCLGKSGHLGIVSCQDYENGPGDHMAIKGHDGPTSDLLSLNNCHTSLKNYFFEESGL